MLINLPILEKILLITLIMQEIHRKCLVEWD